MRMRFRLAVALAAVVGSLSAATVGVDPDCGAMGSVAWTEKKLANGTSRLTLKATAEEGYAFAEWAVSEDDVVAWTDDRRYPGTLTATVSSNAVVTAFFVACADDCLSLDISEDLSDEMSCDEDATVSLAVDSLSYPTISLRNLPPGLSFDNRTLTVFGRPTSPGLYRIEADAVNESGFTFRSFCTLRVANIEGVRVTGIDTEIPVGEYFHSEIGADDPTDIFSFSETPTALAFTGTVPGLTWNGGWQLLYGTPTEPGEYTLGVKAWFPTGAVETATMTLTVTGADPDDFGLAFDDLESLQVGDALDETCEIGVDTPDSTIRSIAGLPTGLAAAPRYENGARRWFVSGTVRESGFFTVTVQVEDRGGETQRLAKVVRTVTVADVPDVFLPVVSSDVTRGTVSGGGAVSPFSDVTLVATPRRGYVFSGWHDPYGERLVLADGIDYRTSEVTLPAGTDFALLAPVAHFAPTADDAAPDLSELEDAEFSFAPDESFQTEFAIDSLSVPTLTFRGFPRGVTCTSDGTGGYVLSYDPWTAVAASGRYAVTVAAVNASGRKSTATFRITVETRSDARIHVYDDYGEFTPGVVIDPIDLSGAVDFARGETLSVSGLPSGLVYNVRANEKRGIGAHTVTGAPTKPGDYTLTFTAKVVSGATTNKAGKVTYAYETATATAFLTVLPYPALEIDVGEDAAEAGCKVTGAGNHKPGSKVTLKATAAKGWVFAGWEGFDEIDGLAALNPQLTYVSGGDDLWVSAAFLPVSEDMLYVDAPVLTESGFAAEWPLKEELGEGDGMLVSDLIESGSWPTVKVDGLPPGVKFSAATFRLSGKPTKSGVFHVTVTAKNAGGYSFVRVFDVAVANADGTLPSEKPLANEAGIDFAPLSELTTGVFVPTGRVVLAVGAHPTTGAAVKKVSVSGLPGGVTARTALADAGARVEVTGTPSKPGRFTVSVSVSYESGKTLKSQTAVVVEDGGSQYLFVTTADQDAGTVSGEGVYAAGATVKLVAKAKSKQVFAGWTVADEGGERSLFTTLRDRDGVDPRSAAVSFPFRPADFTERFELVGSFVASARDIAPTILVEDAVWEISPSEASAFVFAVQSLSVPKVTISGLPKGVTADSVRGLLSYAPTSSVQPGIYTATLSAKNATVSKATVRTIEIRVANRVSDEIGGLDPDMDAYPLTVGVAIGPEKIVPQVGDRWTIVAKGLPSGLSFTGGAVTGTPSKAGDYTVTFTATKGKGASLMTETATVTLRVSALPAVLCGTFVGVLLDENGDVAGTANMTATAAGKVSVSAATAAKTVAFSAKAWDRLADGVATVAMSGKGQTSCELSVLVTDDWQAWQVSGSVVIDGRTLRMSAQRNPYGTKDGSEEARAVAAAWAGTKKTDGWTLKLKENGTVTLSGKQSGRSVSGSSVLQVSEGEFFARFVIFLGKNSVLSIVFFFDADGQIASWTVE